MTYSALICGISGTELTPDERAFLADVRPCGVILFKRNCDTPDQLRRLTASLRDLFGDADFLILIDQEGGRVQRLGPPHWRRYPPGAAFCDRLGGASEQALSAAYAAARLIADDLHAAGINVNCAPVLDVPAPGAHGIIGDRAYAVDAQTVAAFGRAVAQGFLDGGVLPVIKHIPGHGRANADSHFSLPVVKTGLDDLRATDFAPFRSLSDMPLAMTAHVVYESIDARAPASTSRTVIEDVVRGEIGFDGLLMCDDIGMGALSGGLAHRAQAVLAAGCDVVLHCDGKLGSMEKIAGVTPRLAGEALRRFENAVRRLAAPAPYDFAAAQQLLREMLAEQA